MKIVTFFFFFFFIVTFSYYFWLRWFKWHWKANKHATTFMFVLFNIWIINGSKIIFIRNTFMGFWNPSPILKSKAFSKFLLWEARFWCSNLENVFIVESNGLKVEILFPKLRRITISYKYTKTYIVAFFMLVNWILKWFFL